MECVLSIAQLERLLTLARRDHNGEVVIAPAERNGLGYVKATVLLTDMGKDTPPLHIFLVSPRGVATLP